MVTTDPIADMLTRIRNAIAVNRHEVNVPYSKLKHTVAEQLKETKFLDNVKVEGDGVAKVIKINIYKTGTNPKITEISRVSKPGRRYYVKANDIPVVKNGRGLVIMSTSKGVMTGNKAATEKLGGEVLCKVY